MIIRCPNCEYSRTININAIPQTAELATCPKCKHRFRFRTLTAALDEEEAGRRDAPSPPPRPARNGQAAPSGSQGLDIWDAVDALNQQWERQLEQHVTEVITPVPQAAAQTEERQAGAARPEDYPLFVEVQPKTAEPAGPQAETGKQPAPRMEAEDNTAPLPETETHAAGRLESGVNGSTQAAAAFQAGLGMRAGEDGKCRGNPDVQAGEAAGLQAAPPRQAEKINGSAVSANGRTGLSPEDQTDTPAPGHAAPPAPEQHPAGAGTGMDTAAAAHHAPSASAPAFSPDMAHLAAAAHAGQTGTGPAAFPYANDDTSPEERVERDILLLRGSGERPMRDLGRLDEYGAGSGSGGEGAAGGDIPWEMPEKYGWIQAFIKTVHEVMFNAPSFFSRLRPSGTLASEYLFFLLLGYIGILGSVAWTRTALLLIPSLREDTGTGLSLPAVLLLAPLALGLMQVCVTGGIRIIQRLFSSEPLDFSLVFKIVSYSVAPFVLSVVPFVGPVVGAIWFLATLFIGCRHGLGLSWRRAVAVPLLPALVLIYGVAWYFL